MSIELNGLSNIKMELDFLKEQIGGHLLANKCISNIQKQVEYLERYMLAVEHTASAHKAGLEYFQGKFQDDQGRYPYWHEVIENPNRYPTRKEAL